MNWNTTEVWQRPHCQNPVAYNMTVNVYLLVYTGQVQVSIGLYNTNTEEERRSVRGSFPHNSFNPTTFQHWNMYHLCVQVLFLFKVYGFRFVHTLASIAIDVAIAGSLKREDLRACTPANGDHIGNCDICVILWI